jgi:hypothetical protein
MHGEAMNWSGMGTPNMPQRSVFRRMRSADVAIAWKNPVTNRLAIPASPECPGSIKQRY